jgi:hypothetical protein
MPEDAYGSYFFYFVLIECGGALVVLFTTHFRERARAASNVHRGPRARKSGNLVSGFGDCVFCIPLFRTEPPASRVFGNFGR